MSGMGWIPLESNPEVLNTVRMGKKKRKEKNKIKKMKKIKISQNNKDQRNAMKHKLEQKPNCKCIMNKCY